MPFLTPIRIEFIDGDNWRLTEPVVYQTKDGKQSFHIPAGFITDFASVPRGLWNIFPPAGRYAGAAVVHDFLYRYGIGKKSDADKVFREAMAEEQVGFVARWLMWGAVRVGGHGAFKRSHASV